MSQPTIDGITLNAGSGGSSLAGDTVAANFWQAVLVGFSAGDGAASVVMADTGLPVAPATGASWAITAAALPLPTGAATAAKQPALGTAGTPSSDVISVQGVAGGTAIPVSGTFYQATQPVSGTVTANAGTNLNTSALALESGGNLAAAVTALQLIDNAVSGAGFNVTQFAGAAVPIGAGTEAAALRVTIATDSTGTLSIDDGGGAITVDGTVAVSGSVAITAAALPLPSGAATNATLTTLSGKVVACNTGAVVLSAGISFIGFTGFDSSNVYDGATACEVKRFRVKCGNGANTLISAVVGKKFRLRSLAMLATSATVVTLYLSTTTDTGVLGDATDPLTFDLDGGGGPAGVVLPHNPDGWLETSTANEALTATLSAAEEVWIIGTYIEVA